jgi:hypothetical protein
VKVDIEDESVCVDCGVVVEFDVETIEGVEFGGGLWKRNFKNINNVRIYNWILSSSKENFVCR